MRRALNRLRRECQADRVGFIELKLGEWHRVVPGSQEHGSHLVLCTGERRIPRRTAVDMLEKDSICAACVAAESRDKNVG
jgi:hypothetical protein